MSKRTLIALSILMIALAAPAKKIGGKKLPDTLSLSGENLVLNGAGLRKKLFIKVYAGALYLKKKSKDKQAIVNADEHMMVRMHFIYSKVEADKLIGA